MTGSRRGRPPGSKNRTGGFVDPATATAASFTLPGPFYGQGGPGEPIGPTIRVILSFRKAFGDESSEQEVEWPAAWRLPLQGERIHLSATFGGIVSTLDFDVERGLIVIHLR